jgi:hypothetical protein
MSDSAYRKWYPVVGRVDGEVDVMRHATRRAANDEQPGRPVAPRKGRDDRLSVGLSMLVWVVMAGLAWVLVALALRLS